MFSAVVRSSWSAFGRRREIRLAFGRAAPITTTNYFAIDNTTIKRESGLSSVRRLTRLLTITNMASSSSSSAAIPASALAATASRSAATSSVSLAAGGDKVQPAVAAGGKNLKVFLSGAKHSALEELTPDPETAEHAPNHTARQVFSGHYVLCAPTPLPSPFLVTYSPEMASELGLSEEACRSPDFTRVFSGDLEPAPELTSFATPYALSIYGQVIPAPDPFGTGNGYGDGRAVSLGEVHVPSTGKTWEFQLKGGGPTPFCRGADGRAVLRSSIREFLASEAMHAMGVSTTRALSLVASGTATVQRPWYSNSESPAELPDARQLAMMQAMGVSFRDPDKMQSEQCAITCRVAPSFLRVGHFELYARRVARGDDDGALAQLEQLFRHLVRREYADEVPASARATMPLCDQVEAVLSGFARRISKMVAGWLRVGYVQSNFNADNCLVAGRTMDYGPFGFLEQYESDWCMWIGGGAKYGFQNQPEVAFANFVSFASALVPLVAETEGKEGIERIQRAADGFRDTMRKTCNIMWSQKIGLMGAAEAAVAEAGIICSGGEEEDGGSGGGGGGGAAAADDAWAPDAAAYAQDCQEELMDLLDNSHPDYTIFFRQLATVVEAPPGTPESALLELLEPAFYGPLEPCWTRQYTDLVVGIREELQRRGVDTKARAQEMRLVSPKYVPREWMLVEAYTKAQCGDYAQVKELQRIFASPFDEHDAETEALYYRKRPEGADKTGGTGFMS